MDQNLKDEDVCIWVEKFYGLDGGSGYLQGAAAFQYFQQTNLERLILKTIWELADVDKDGRLDASEFCLAMFLIREYQCTSSLPSATDDTLYPLIKDIVSQQPHHPSNPLPESCSIRPDEYQMWLPIFEENNQSGSVGGEEAVRVFSLSGLGRPELKQIYSLCDLDRDGLLSLPEFIMAMKICKERSKGFALPSTLPTALVDSARLLTDPAKSDSDSVGVGEC